MATGYTAKIEEGISFKDFVLTCATAFYGGRDGNTILRKEADSSNLEYYRKEVDDAQKKLKDIEDASDEMLINTEITRAKNQIKYYKNNILKIKALRKKYDKMLKEVKAWIVPSPDHQYFKEFMVDQIKQSIEYDCDLKYTVKSIKDNEKIVKNLKGKKKFKKFRKELLEGAKRTLSYYTGRLQEAQENYDIANKWISGIHESMKKYN